MKLKHLRQLLSTSKPRSDTPAAHANDLSEDSKWGELDSAYGFLRSLAHGNDRKLPTNLVEAFRKQRSQVPAGDEGYTFMSTYKHGQWHEQSLEETKSLAQEVPAIPEVIGAAMSFVESHARSHEERIDSDLRYKRSEPSDASLATDCKDVIHQGLESQEKPLPHRTVRHTETCSTGQALALDVSTPTVAIDTDHITVQRANEEVPIEHLAEDVQEDVHVSDHAGADLETEDLDDETTLASSTSSDEVVSQPSPTETFVSEESIHAAKPVEDQGKDFELDVESAEKPGLEESHREAHSVEEFASTEHERSTETATKSGTAELLLKEDPNDGAEPVTLIGDTSCTDECEPEVFAGGAESSNDNTEAVRYATKDSRDRVSTADASEISSPALWSITDYNQDSPALDFDLAFSNTFVTLKQGSSEIPAFIPSRDCYEELKNWFLKKQAVILARQHLNSVERECRDQKKVIDEHREVLVKVHDSVMDSLSIEKPADAVAHVSEMMRLEAGLVEMKTALNGIEAFELAQLENLESAKVDDGFVNEVYRRMKALGAANGSTSASIADVGTTLLGEVSQLCASVQSGDFASIRFPGWPSDCQFDGQYKDLSYSMRYCEWSPLLGPREYVREEFHFYDQQLRCLEEELKEIQVHKRATNTRQHAWSDDVQGPRINTGGGLTHIEEQLKTYLHFLKASSLVAYERWNYIPGVRPWDVDSSLFIETSEGPFIPPGYAMTANMEVKVGQAFGHVTACPNEGEGNEHFANGGCGVCHDWYEFDPVGDANSTTTNEHIKTWLLTIGGDGGAVNSPELDAWDWREVMLIDNHNDDVDYYLNYAVHEGLKHGLLVSSTNLLGYEKTYRYPNSFSSFDCGRAYQRLLQDAYGLVDDLGGMTGGWCIKPPYPPVHRSSVDDAFPAIANSREKESPNEAVFGENGYIIQDTMDRKDDQRTESTSLHIAQKRIPGDFGPVKPPQARERAEANCREGVQNSGNHLKLSRLPFGTCGSNVPLARPHQPSMSTTSATDTANAKTRGKSSHQDKMRLPSTEKKPRKGKGRRAERHLKDLMNDETFFENLR